MWTRHAVIQEETSAIRALPYVTRDLRKKNQTRDREQNTANEPYVYKTPDKWIFLGVIALYSGVTVGGVVNGLFNLILALA